MLNHKSIQINGHDFVWGSKTYVMGIINLTPDSFSGDGLSAQDNLKNVVLKQAENFISTGAHILDIGGESTRPGSEEISEDEEANRVLPIVEIIRNNFDIPISIDTYKSKIADQAIQLGANIVNDVWALRADVKMAEIVAKHQVPIILMHNRSTPKSAAFEKKLGGRYIGVKYQDLIEDIKSELMISVNLAISVGIEESNIILDSGIGFGKTVEQNLSLLNQGDKIRELGFPLLIGPSRKSFIGYTLDLPPDQRVEGTAATITVAITRGADIIRVHDVLEMARIAKMTDAIVRGNNN